MICVQYPENPAQGKADSAKISASTLCLGDARLVRQSLTAANVYLLEAEDFGGSLNLQAGWGWRGKNARLLRAGVFYSNGLSNSFVPEDRNEQQFGFGIRHDF
jgi:hypothetical protein